MVPAGPRPLRRKPYAAAALGIIAAQYVIVALIYAAWSRPLPTPTF